MKQQERIAYFETVFDSVSDAVRQVYLAAGQLAQLQPQVDELTAYYTGKEWKKDFAADEAGLLPSTLKRGVLSEDGIDHLLDEVQQITSLLTED